MTPTCVCVYVSHESGHHPIGCVQFDAGEGVQGHGVCRQLSSLLLVGKLRMLPAYLRGAVDRGLLRKSGDPGFDGTGVPPGRARLMGAGKAKGTQHYPVVKWTQHS